MIMFARDDAPPPLTDEQQELFDAYVPAVKALAQRRASPSIPFEDHLQHGLMGLLDAARRFDPERGLRFWTFASPRVSWAMTDAERAGFGVMIHVPRAAWSSYGDNDRFQGSRFEAAERECSADDEADWWMVAAPSDESPLDTEAIWLAVNTLGKRERRIVKLLYVRGLPRREIAERLGCHPSRVTQLHSDILEQLRTNPRVLAASGRRATG